MNAVPTFSLLARWLERGDRDDLIVALDGLRETDVPLHEHDGNALRYLITRKRMPRRERAFALAPIVWTLVHQASGWRPNEGELRALLALALRVRQEIRNPSHIVGGDRGYVNLTGLLWWAGRHSEPDTFRPRVAMLSRFVDGENVETFRQNLLDDAASDKQRQRERLSQRHRREQIALERGLMDQLRVYGYDTRNLLGRPSPRLIQRSAETEAGAVPAYLDSSNGLWECVAPQDVEHYRRNLHVDVIMVYVA